MSEHSRSRRPTASAEDVGVSDRVGSPDRAGSSDVPGSPDAIDRVQRELTTIARRGTLRARREPGEPLTAAERTLLGYIQANPGCRLVDIATHFGLNKSTLTKQARRLLELELVEAAASPDGRGHALTLTREGEHRERGLARGLREALTERLAGWSDSDLDAFAGMLERFNAVTGDGTAG